MVMLSPGARSTRRGEIVGSFCGVVWATVPTKVDALPYLDLLASSQKWQKSSLFADASPRFRAVAESLQGEILEQALPGAALGILFDGQEKCGAFDIEQDR